MTVSSNYNGYSSASSYGVSASSQRGKPNFDEMAQQLLNSMDSDKSGSIDKTEFTTAVQALESNSKSSSTSTSTAAGSDGTSATDTFNQLDTNGDGGLSTDELMTALKNSKPPHGKEGGMAPPPGGMPPPPPPENQSSDGSSSSDSASGSSATDKVFSALDTNKDGTISIDELLASLGNNSDSSTGSGTSGNLADSSSQKDAASQKLSDFMLKNILSYYGSNAASTDSTSLLSVSA